MKLKFEIIGNLGADATVREVNQPEWLLYFFTTPKGCEKISGIELNTL